MTPRRYTARLALLVVLALGAGAWLYFPTALPGQAPASPPQAAAPPSSASPTAALPPSAAIARAHPLPPADAPLASVAALLAARADAGDGRAACRLSHELRRCVAEARRRARHEERLLRRIERRGAQGDQAGVRTAEAELSQLSVAAQACADVPEQIAQRALHYLRVAALAGEPVALYDYASGTAFEELEQGYGYLATPEFDRWRSEAQGLMRRALAQGSAQAALALRGAYVSDDSLFAGLVPDDSVPAYAHARLTERLFGDTLAAFPVPLTRPGVAEADLARAEALAADWHQDYFGGRQVDLASLLQPAMTPGGDPCPDRSGDRG